MLELNHSDNNKKIILDLCGGSGSWSRPYKEAGYDVRVITLPNYDVTDVVFSSDYMVFNKQTYDVNDMGVDYARVYGILAAPPCTEFSHVKNEKLQRDIDGGLKIVNACLEIIDVCKPICWALENPAGKLRHYIGEPQMVFQPWQFGDAWTKRTHIWGKFNKPIQQYKKYEDVEEIPGLYKRPGRNKVNFVWLHKSAISKIPQLRCFNPNTDADFRAITPQVLLKRFSKQISKRRDYNARTKPHLTK